MSLATAAMPLRRGALTTVQSHLQVSARRQAQLAVCQQAGLTSLIRQGLHRQQQALRPCPRPAFACNPYASYSLPETRRAEWGRCVRLSTRPRFLLPAPATPRSPPWRWKSCKTRSSAPLSSSAHCAVQRWRRMPAETPRRAPRRRAPRCARPVLSIKRSSVRVSNAAPPAACARAFKRMRPSCRRHARRRGRRGRPFEPRQAADWIGKIEGPLALAGPFSVLRRPRPRRQFGAFGVSDRLH